jgi:hypothetical protein
MLGKIVICLILITGSACGGQRVFDKYDEAASESQKTGKPMLVLIKAAWCKPCHTLKSTLNGMIADGELDSQVVCFLDADERPGDVERLTKLKVYPQLHWYKTPGGGGRWVKGAVSRERILQLIGGKQ